MRLVRKLMSLLLCLAMIISMTLPAFAANMPKLTSLELTDAAHISKMVPDFDPDIKEYTMTVEEDVLGVLVNAKAAPGNTVTVTGSLTSASYPDGVERHPASSRHPENHFDGGTTVLTLTRDATYGPGVTNTEYDSESVVTATITVANLEGSSDYTITITRKAGKPVYDLFDSYDGAAGYLATNGTRVPYNIYVPSDVQPGEKLPVVYALHGTGQRSTLQHVNMILKRTPQATVWAKDSDAGIRRCIVIAPQASATSFSSTVAGEVRTSNVGDAAYELLLKLMDDYSDIVDRDRVYITGLSMGGAGALATLATYPDTFAAAFINCPAGVLAESQTAVIKNIPMRLVHAAADGSSYFSGGVSPNNSRTLAGRMIAAEAVDFAYEEYPIGTYLYETEHFSWVPAYYTESYREWMFDQVRPAAPSVLKLTTAAHNVKAGDYFTMNTTFTEKQSSNAAILTYTFDGDKFEYANFTPADGVQVVNTEYDKGSAKITLISMNYDMETFGDIMLRAKEGAELAREFQTVSLAAEYVLKDEDGNKEILTAGASARFTTLGNGTIEPVEPGDTNDDGVVDLIDLSNMIDWFGTTSGDADWETLYTFFDFNNNGEIDINDISYVARLIK